MTSGSRPTDAMSGFSRRGLLLGGLGVVGGAMLLSGCSQGASTAGQSATQASKGGTMRIARPIASTAETLDPAGALCAYEYLGALYNRLVKQDEGGTIVADLAINWESSSDARTWTITLRDDVVFHDGKPFTSADVKYTLSHLLDPATGSPQAGVLSPFLSVAGISTPDATTVQMQLDQPNAEFISLLSHYNCYIIPDGSAASIGQSGIGTGPFKLKSFVPAGAGSVERNTDYFDGTSVLDAIEFTAIGDVQARVNALLSGQVELVAQTALDTASSKLIAANANLTTATVPNAIMYVMPMLYTADPFTDVNVRRAFKMAFDPTEVLNLSVGGAGTIANSNPVLPNNPFWLDYKLDYDPDAAKALLKKAGFNSIDQVLYTSSVDPGLNPLALAYQGSVKAAGINIEVKNAAADSYYTDVWMNQPLMTSYWYTGRPIDQQLNEVFRSGSSYNESRWSNPDFDGLLDAARAEVDTDRRKTLYQDAQKLLIDDGSTIIPFFADRITGLSKKVVGYKEFAFEFDYLNIGLAA